MFAKAVISFRCSDVDKESAGAKPANSAAALENARKRVSLERDVLFGGNHGEHAWLQHVDPRIDVAGARIRRLLLTKSDNRIVIGQIKSSSPVLTCTDIERLSY